MASFRLLFRLALPLAAIASLTLGVSADRQGPSNATDPAVQKDYESGLLVWRSNGVGNSSCSFCHAPDALELASYAFDDDTLRRRATPHLGADGAEKIVSFIHAVRKKYGITKLLDPMKDRPLQPGGEVLPGATPQERDLAFGKELQTALPTLAGGKVDSLEAAERGKKELLDLDARKLRIGIPFNRISEDGFHGKEHATFAHWIPDVAVSIRFPWEFFFVKQDQYFQKPTDASLLDLVQFAHPLSVHVSLSEQMSNDKYRALLIYQHALRMKVLGEDPFDNVGPVLFGKLVAKEEPNPLFDLGVFADERTDTPFTEFHFPDNTLEKKIGGPNEADQLRQIRLPSLYAGWLMDQGLQRTAGCPDQRATTILTQRLLSDGPYPIHDAFVIAKKLVTQGFAPEACGTGAQPRFVVDFSSFLEDSNVSKFEPADPAGRELYRRFVVNVFKMSLYLYKDQQGRDGGHPSASQISEIEAYVKAVAPSSLPEIKSLAKAIEGT